MHGSLFNCAFQDQEKGVLGVTAHLHYNICCFTASPRVQWMKSEDCRDINSVSDLMQ